MCDEARHLRLLPLSFRIGLVVTAIAIHSRTLPLGSFYIIGVKFTILDGSELMWSADNSLDKLFGPSGFSNN